MSTQTRKELSLYTVDAFTKSPFSGNPAAVCLLSSNDDLESKDMQRIAAEINLSETAFVRSLRDDGGEESFQTDWKFQLRWFTPTNEVPLCGHATLASAAILFFIIGNRCEKIEFETLSGGLGTRRDGDEIVMDFPLNPTISQEPSDYSDLLKDIVEEKLVSSVEYSPKTKKLLVRLDSGVTRETLERLKPDTQLMMRHDLPQDVRGVIVTVKDTESSSCGDQVTGYDFLSRYFAPWNGIPEDPVTGSAHTVLASYWSQELCKTQMFARQCSPRGGDVRMTLIGDRVELSGQAVVMFKGKLTL